MKQLHTIGLFALLALGLACQGDKPPEGYLHGSAETLWNEPLDLAAYNTGVTIINPFSTSNCGYCMFDGDFIRENYYRRAAERGDAFFGLCLFNPQRDIYTFQKHYRESPPVITSPLALHREYHNNGFPWLTVAKDGESVFQAVMTPYDYVFDSLAPVMWPEDPPALRPTSPLHMADRFIGENDRLDAVIVVADGDTAFITRFREHQEQLRERYAAQGWEYHPSNVPKYASELTEDDLKKSLQFYGDKLRLEVFRDKDIPVKVTEKTVTIGPFTFPRSEVYVRACFPNPYAPTEYVSLILGRGLSGFVPFNYLDYMVARNGTTDILIRGHFDKSGPTWKFDPDRCIMSPAVKSFCADGVCPLPIDVSRTRPKLAKAVEESPLTETNTPHGPLFTFGAGTARFPRIAVDKQNTPWVTWEEDGDILLSSVQPVDSRRLYRIEHDSSDSFDPVIAAAGNDLWIFYLNDIEGYYRLYGRYLNGGDLSPEIAFSDRLASDVITPAVAGHENGSVVLAWSEWKANYKFPYYRLIDNRVPGEIKPVHHKIAENMPDYTCAWYPALAVASDGTIRSAWNQHYPETFAAFSGDLDSEGIAIGEGDIGGYPAVAFDRDNTFWVFWESYLWNRASGGEPQTIRAAFYDPGRNAFSVPGVVSDENQTVFNQTPCAAAGPDGPLWVAWSGRREELRPWGIYLVGKKDDTWSEPVLVSPDREHARAPSLAAAPDGAVWLAWHAGTGDAMKIKVLRYRPGPSL